MRRPKWWTGILSYLAIIAKYTYKNRQPEPSIPFLEQFFRGSLSGHGVLQTRWGRVLDRFTVRMDVYWDNQAATIEESYQFEQAEEVKERSWKIDKTLNGYAAYAMNILGKAEGSSDASSVTWQYRVLIPIKGRAVLCTIQDTAWRVTENTAINRIKIYKFGIQFAEMTVFIHRGRGGVV